MIIDETREYADRLGDFVYFGRLLEDELREKSVDPKIVDITRTITNSIVIFYGLERRTRQQNLINLAQLPESRELDYQMLRLKLSLQESCQGLPSNVAEHAVKEEPSAVSMVYLFAIREKYCPSMKLPDQLGSIVSAKI